MKIIDKAIKLSYDTFTPNEFQRRYHYAIAFSGKKPILVCENNPIKINSKAYKMGKRFNIQTYKEFPYIHAESHLNFWTGIMRLTTISLLLFSGLIVRERFY
jgi:hypothetical protein